MEFRHTRCNRTHNRMGLTLNVNFASKMAVKLPFQSNIEFTGSHAIIVTLKVTLKVTLSNEIISCAKTIHIGKRRFIEFIFDEDQTPESLKFHPT